MAGPSRASRSHSETRRLRTVPVSRYLVASPFPPVSGCGQVALLELTQSDTHRSQSGAGDSGCIQPTLPQRYLRPLPPSLFWQVRSGSPAVREVQRGTSMLGWIPSRRRRRWSPPFSPPSFQAARCLAPVFGHDLSYRNHPHSSKHRPLHLKRSLRALLSMIRPLSKSLLSLEPTDRDSDSFSRKSLTPTNTLN